MCGSCGTMEPLSIEVGVAFRAAAPTCGTQLQHPACMPVHPLLAATAGLRSLASPLQAGHDCSTACPCMRPPAAPPSGSHSARHAARRQALANLRPCQAALVHLPMLALRHDGRLLQH